MVGGNLIMASHAFAICAYGQSPYLRECIESVLNQQDDDGHPVKSEVFIATATPSAWLDGIAAGYGLAVVVNDGEHGIGQDWNFAYSQATADYITITHQDDIYCPRYASTAISALSQSGSSLIFFSDYGELRAGKRVDENRLLSTKRRLLAPLKDGRHADSISRRRRVLSLGSPICCPSVTFNRRNCPNPPFEVTMKCSLDWDTWEHLSRLEGGFYYSSDILMYHRIHEDSATSSYIEDNTRANEDLELFRRFWPSPIAKIISRAYSSSEKSNDV